MNEKYCNFYKKIQFPFIRDSKIECSLDPKNLELAEVVPEVESLDECMFLCFNSRVGIVDFIRKFESDLYYEGEQNIKAIPTRDKL